MKYRKKPVVIEAYQFTKKIVEDYFFDNVPLPEGIEITKLSGHLKDRKLYDYIVRIETLEGETYKVKEGDWIIKGIKGEFYPCANDIFEATYERVEN